MLGSHFCVVSERKKNGNDYSDHTTGKSRILQRASAVPNTLPFGARGSFGGCIARLVIEVIQKCQGNNLFLLAASGHLSLWSLWAWGPVLSAWTAERILLWSQARALWCGSALLPNLSPCLLSLWPNSCMENWGNDLYVVSSSDRCTRSWLPPAPGLIGSLSLPLYNRELSGSMTRQTIQSFRGEFTLESGRSDTGGAPWRSRPDTDENSDSQGLGGNRTTLASGI